MRTRTIRLVTLSAVASLAIAGGAQAKNGADDPAGHVRHGADDGITHVRGNGADDPANHDANDDRVTGKDRTKKARHRHRGHRGRHHRHHAGSHARRGADDRPGHVRHGGGKDDPQPHS
jgi:hypothetical protein